MVHILIREIMEQKFSGLGEMVGFFAGLSNVMDELDPNDKDYPYFLKLYKKMAKKLLEIQTPEGHWAMSLLGQKFYPTPETSGSSFFIYGLCMGN